MLFAVLAMTAAGQNASAPYARPVQRVTQAIDDTNLVSLEGNIHPLATASADQGAAPDSLPIGRTILVLKRSGAQADALRKLLDDQQNPQSPTYHKWLTPSQFGQQFGVASADIEKITGWLESNGLQVEPVMPGRSQIVFSGTSGQLKNAFHVQLHKYDVAGKSYWANANNPQIPAALASVVSGFSSLNNFPIRPLHSEPRVVKKSKAGWAFADGGAKPAFTTTDNGSAIYAIAPYDLATIYNIAPLWNAGIDGTGQTIAIVAESDINPADVDYFRSTFGLPPTKLNIINYGADPGYNSSEGEADLDVEWAGAVAKNATIDLIVSAPTTTSGGISGAALYAVNNNLASILNVSYGSCEPVLGVSGNIFFSEVWEQAAAQGITVFVASGDAGSAACDQNEAYAQNGLTVSGISSTPYNVSVGGTDLYGTFTAPSQYWNSTNNSTTLQSAISYIPELPWNNTCASPEVLATLESFGYSGTTNTALCNDAKEQGSFLNTQGGSGGASSCIKTDGNGNCIAGYPKPAWQSGVTGIPSDGVRDLPDVSLMAGNGIWNTFYAYCDSDALPDGTCDVNSELQGAGGTSFASPIFAGIMALVQQQTNGSQGNANYVLYKLAASQYADPNNEATCATANAKSGNSCVFYDVTDGTNAVPCAGGTKNCSAQAGGVGILPGYNSGVGYDLSTGLGTVNVANLVNGWSSAASNLISTTVTLTASGPTTVPYGTNVDLNVSVASSGSSTGTPSGDVGITSNSTTPNNAAVAEGTLSGGQASIAAQALITGTYQLFAHYTGDATFAAAESTGVTVTIQPGAATLMFTASRQTVLTGQSTTLLLNVTGVTNGVYPTGTVTFTDTTSGATLGTATLSPGSSSGAAQSTAYITVPSKQLQAGANSITASYSGDANYAAAVSSSLTVTAASDFTASLSPSSLTLAPNASGTVTVTATPNGSATLTPSSLTFACPGNLPAGIACTFGAPTAGAGGTVSSVLTLQLASPLNVKPITVARSNGRGSVAGAGALAGLACVLMLGCAGKHKRILPVLLLVAFTSAALLNGCGGGASGGGTTSKPSLTATTTTLSINPSAPAYNTPATLTAKVSSASGSGTPTGTVTFLSGSTTLGTATLASGSATYTASALPVGQQSLTASYSGDASFAASTSAAQSADVSYATTLTIAVSDNQGNSSNANLTLTVQ